MKIATTLMIALACLTQGNALASEADDIAEVIRATEVKGGSITNLSPKKLKEIATLSLEVESKREKYARALDLFLEGLGSDKDVDTSRVEYEKAQVNLADKWNKTRELLDVLKKQEVLAQKWKRERVEKKDRARSSDSAAETTNQSHTDAALSGTGNRSEVKERSTNATKSGVAGVSSSHNVPTQKASDGNVVHIGANGKPLAESGAGSQDASTSETKFSNHAFDDSVRVRTKPATADVNQGVEREDLFKLVNEK